MSSRALETTVPLPMGRRVVVCEVTALPNTHRLTVEGHFIRAGFTGSEQDLRAVGRAIYRHLDRIAAERRSP